MAPSNISSPRKSTAIISKPGKPELATIVPKLVAWLREHQYQVAVDPETAPYAPSAEAIPREEIAARPLNFVVVLGGDGTLLAAARAVAQAGIPVLGVNLGSLGFLTEVPLQDMYQTLQGLEEGRGTVEVRSMVHCDVMRSGSCVARYDAVNDIVVGKSTIARLNHCDVYVDRVFVSSYQADSLIVSTPTGSTDYARFGSLVDPPCPGGPGYFRNRDPGQDGFRRGVCQRGRPIGHAHARWGSCAVPQVRAPGQAVAAAGIVFRRVARQTEVGTKIANTPACGQLI
jgi:hypothetical protein